MSFFPSGPPYPSGFNPNLLFGMTFCAEGRACRLAGLFIFPVTIPTRVVKGLFGGDFGILGVTTCALWRRCTFLIVMMAILTILQIVDMLFVPNGSPLIRIRCVKPGILDGERILLTEDALQGEQGSKEHNRGNNGKDFFVHETLTSFLFTLFFTKYPDRSQKVRSQQPNL
jgi:hypothetical protein